MDVILGLFEDRVATVRSASAEQRALLSRLRAARARSRSQVAEDVLDLDIDGLRRDLRRLLRAGGGELDDHPRPGPRAAGGGGGGAAAGLQPRGRPVPARGASRAATAHPPAPLRGRGRGRPCAARSPARPSSGSGCRTASASSTTTTCSRAGSRSRRASPRAATTRLLARAARRERRALIGLGRLLHRALLETKPADLALRALQAMARGPVASGLESPRRRDSMQLLIIRHAIAVPRGTPGIPDEDRPLTPEGEQKFREARRGPREARGPARRAPHEPLAAREADRGDRGRRVGPARARGDGRPRQRLVRGAGRGARPVPGRRDGGRGRPRAVGVRAPRAAARHAATTTAWSSRRAGPPSWTFPAASPGAARSSSSCPRRCCGSS